MARRTSITIKSVRDRLSDWLEDDVDASIKRQAEALPLRRDAVTLLEFVRDNKVVGTQSTGNMPLKAVREVAARFVDPPQLDATFAGRTFELRSEEHVWPLYFLHLLADVGGLIRTGRARQWRLTAEGARFLKTEPVLQATFLLAVWWWEVNWLVACPYQGMGEALPYGFPGATLASLRSLPAAKDVPFEEYADKLIDETGLTRVGQDSSHAAMLLQGAIRNMVIATLDRFGALKSRYRKKRLGRGTVSELTAFRITPLGTALLDAMAAIARG